MTSLSANAAARDRLLKPALSVMDQVLVAATGFATSAFVARSLGVDKLGVYAIAYVIVFSARAIQSSIILQPLSVLAPPLRDEQRRAYLGFVLCFEVVSVGCLSVVVAVATAIGTLGPLDRLGVLTVLAALLYANILGLQGLSRRGFYVQQHPGRAVTQAATFAALVGLGLTVLHFGGKATLPGVFLALSVGAGGACLVSFRRWKGALRVPDRPTSRRHLREHWKFGSWLLVTVPFQVGMYQGYFLITGYYLGSLDTGALKAADSFVAPFEQVCIGLSLLFLPRLAQSLGDPHSDWRPWLRTATFRFLGLGAIYSAMLVFVGPSLIVTVFTEGSRPAVSLVGILAAIPVLKALAYPPGIALMAAKRSDLVLLAYVASLVTTASAGVLLIRTQGLTGAAFGLVLSVTVFSVAQWAGVLWLGRDSGSPSVGEALGG